MPNPDEIFGAYVFDDALMQRRLPKETYRALKRTTEQGRSLDPAVAGVVANAMKDWALEIVTVQSILILRGPRCQIQTKLPLQQKKRL